MKNMILTLVLAAFFGLSCGIVYQLTLGNGDINLFRAGSSASVVWEEEQEPDESGHQYLSGNKRTKGVVTNKSKICSVPGCDRSVFVTYRGRELCVKCYTEEKSADVEAETP